ncbi:HTH-like domain-containing protein [Klebsiella grimontii]|uniref:HTH-like domain-containing protein n=1 Tax=Klebsiella TaxID=570 RepID=UPI003BAF0FF4
MHYTVELCLQMLKYAENLKHLTAKEFCKGLISRANLRISVPLRLCVTWAESI